MSTKILIAYASVSGSTGEVAQAIGEVVGEENVTVRVSPVGDVTDVSDYSAAVVGSSIRVGKWLPEAFEFLKAHQETLSQVPVAYFTTCLTMVDDTAENRRTVLAYMDPILQTFPEIKPIALGLFAGSLDPNRQMFMQVKVAPQGDYRDWEAIRSWAAEIRPALQAGEVKPKEAVVLRGAVLSYTDMSSADLQKADLRKADLRGTDLRDADLHKADLRETSLSWADLNLADVSRANLVNANLIGADLHKANLGHANLSGAILNGANLSYADLAGADLGYADLNWADLRGADLSQANLSHAGLGWANLSGANLSGANLNKAMYNNQTQWPDDFSAQAHGAVLVISGDLH